MRFPLPLIYIYVLNEYVHCEHVALRVGYINYLRKTWAQQQDTERSREDERATQGMKY